MQKKITFLTLLFLIIVSANTKSQTWYWTRQADSSSSQISSQVAVDRNNNPVYTGYCSGARMDFGNFGLYITGIQTDFLAKYSTAGTPLWARNATALAASAQVYGMSVATDRNNNVLEAGYFDDSIAFGTYHVSALTAAENTYLVKYDGNGNVLWAKASSPTKTNTIYSNQNYAVSADKQNNIYITGYFEDTVIFGHDTLSASSTDMYLVKYSPAGQVIWAEAPVLGNGAYTYGFSVATDDSGNAYVAGNILDSATFGTIKIGGTGGGSVYLAKFDSSGHAKWALNTGATPGQIIPTPVVVDKSNNVYLGANFTNSTLNFGTYTVTDGAPPCSNSLLAKYTPNGIPIWATCADFISSDEVCTIIESGVTTDNCKNVYWSGLCSDSFGVGNVKVTIPGGGSHPTLAFAYVIKLDSNGSPIAGAAINNRNTTFFSNYLACDSASKVLFASELVAPATIIIGSDTVRRYLTNSTCFLSKFAVIPSIQNINNNDSICAGDSLLLSIPQVIGYTYKWSTGATTDSIYVKPVVTTNYFVAVNNGCVIDTSFITVNVFSLHPAITANPDTVCKGDSAVLTAAGGTTYHWSNGATTSSIHVAPSSNTTYTLTAFSGSCTKDTVLTVYVVATPTAVVASVPDSVCVGDSALLTGSGGNTYRWSTGNTSTSIWVKPNISTTYTLYALAGNCSDSIAVTVGVFPATTATVTPNDTVCPKTPLTLNATGSGGNVTYKWNTGATTTSINVNDTATTTYTVTVHGKCDSVKEMVTVVVIPLAKPVITGNSIECAGSHDTLKISGGTTYKWSNGNTKTTYTTGAIKSDSIITVVAYNSLGCPDTTHFPIAVKAYPTGAITYIPACINNPTILTVTPVGTGPFTYKWSTGSTYDTINILTTNTTYSVVISNGCPTPETITVIPEVPNLYACCNETILAGTDTTIVASGAVSYRWTPSSGLNCDTCATVVATPTATTTYTVIGTDSLGCQTERIVTITIEIPCFDFAVPNVFTPDYSGPQGANGGFNNVFYMQTTNINGWSIYIYDRWGKEVFKSTNPMVYWNGNTEGGGKAPDGVYYYIITATCQNTSYKKDGFLQLIR